MTHPFNRSVFALLAFVALAALAPLSALAAELVSLEGTVEVGRGEPPQWSPAVAGQTLEGGERIRTGADGRVEVRIDGTTLRAYPSSLLRLPEAIASKAKAGVPRVELERGHSLFDVLRGRRGLEVETAEIVVSVKGTRFAVDASTHGVAVFRGAVGVRGLTAELVDEMLVREGFASARNEKGALELLSNSQVDPWQGWGAGEAFPASPAPGAAQGQVMQESLEAARALARPKAIVQAAERNPELRRRLEDAVDASTDEARDGVADVEALEVPLLQKYAEVIASGGAGAGGAGGALSITFLEEYGPSQEEAVMVEQASSGLSLTFDEDFLEDVLDGSMMFPPELLSILSSQGVSEQAFAQALLVIIDD